MARSKNSFRIPPYLEQTIVGANGRPVGTIRVKPDGVAWKPKGKSVFYAVNLDTFSQWITSDEAKARQVK